MPAHLDRDMGSFLLFGVFSHETGAPIFTAPSRVRRSFFEAWCVVHGCGIFQKFDGA
jgi:hypothetical protein